MEGTALKLLLFKTWPTEPKVNQKKKQKKDLLKLLLPVKCRESSEVKKWNKSKVNKNIK